MNDLRRLFSLSGVFPVGVFVVYHLFALLRIGRAPMAAGDSASKLGLWVDIFLIVLPLAFHALLGVRLAISPGPDGYRAPFRSDATDRLMKITGFVTLIFVVVHVWQFRVRLLLDQTASADFPSELAASLSSTGPGNVPYAAVGYLIALAATTYHLAIGMQGFCARFGFVKDERQNRKVGLICSIAGVVLFAIGARSVVYLATGKTFFD